MERQNLKPVVLPIAILILFNFLQLIHPLPIFLQLLVNAGLTIHVGCILSVSLGKASYKEIRQCQQQLRANNREDSAWMNVWEIAKYPVVGCIVLLTLYFFIKSTNQITINTILDVMFICGTTIYGSTRLHRLLIDSLRDLAKGVQLKENYEKVVLGLSKYFLCPAFVALLCLLFTVHRHWLLNNLFALFFAVGTLKQTSLKSFKIALPTLWILFFYDLYWVYQSDVMVTVAKNVDLPLKLLFPYLNNSNEIKFSILGLGDIIIPGLFLSLCLKYDVDNCILSISKPKSTKDFKLPLYNISLGLYILGISLTYTAMFIFNHAQPALVFIVPCLNLSLIANRYLERRLPLISYSTQVLRKTQQSSQVI